MIYALLGLIVALLIFPGLRGPLAVLTGWSVFLAVLVVVAVLVTT